MRLRLRHLCLISTVVAATGGPSLAGGIYTQLVMPFANERQVSQHYDKTEHALVLMIAKTSPNELPALDHYDERLIKRAVVKDLGPAGTEIKLILRDRDVRALVSEFKEPFRIAVDIFDADYSEERDPQTGLPLADVDHQAVSGDHNTAGDEHAKEHRPLKFLNQDHEETASPRSAPSGHQRLLAPAPEVFVSPEELNAGLRQVPEGIGKSWRDFPPYIYRVQTAVYEEGTHHRGQPPAPSLPALSSTEAMADYAGKLFNFGHEAKALIAYEQVLHRDPSIFERDALHLWKFAEVQLGQGNLTLAEGYFTALVEKHPESPLANFARMRCLDIIAIRRLGDGTYSTVSNLLPKLALIKAKQSGELAAQIALRQAWWDPATLAKSEDPKMLPLLPAPVYATLARLTQPSKAREQRFSPQVYCSAIC